MRERDYTFILIVVHVILCYTRTDVARAFDFVLLNTGF